MNDKQWFYHSLILPVCFIIVIWSVKIIETSFDTSFYFLGIYPLKMNGLQGVIFSPLIHGDWKHLLNNSVPFLILCTATIYFYRPLGYKVFFLTWLMTGLWVWFGARQAWHIGASGIVYGLAAFLFFSGSIRRVPGLAAISLIVIFLYGSMIWGIFPFIPDISWEAHLSGGIAGFILAVVFRKDGPQPKVYELDDDTSTENMSDEEANDLIEKYKSNNG